SCVYPARLCFSRVRQLPRATLFPCTTLFRSAAALDAGLRAYMLRVYNWMASGLLVTAIVSYMIANTGLSELFFNVVRTPRGLARSEEHTSELQSRENLVCRLLLEKKKKRLAR